MEIEDIIKNAQEKNEIGAVMEECLLTELADLRESDLALKAIINNNVNIKFDIIFCDTYKEYVKLNKHMSNKQLLSEIEFKIIKQKVLNGGEQNDNVQQNTLFSK